MKKLSPSQKEKTKKKSTLRHVIFKFLKKKFLKREKEKWHIICDHFRFQTFSKELARVMLFPQNLKNNNNRLF